MDTTNSIFASVCDYLKEEVLRGLGSRLYDGRCVDELETGWLPSGRAGVESPVKIKVAVQAPGYGFVPGDQACVVVRAGHEIDAPKPIDLSEVSLDEFRAWLGEVKAAAQRWS